MTAQQPAGSRSAPDGGWPQAALIWQAAYLVFVGVAVILATTLLFFFVTAHGRSVPAEPPLALFGFFGVLPVCGLRGWVFNVVLVVVYGVKAQGEWARYPFVGDFVLERILLYQRFS